MLFISAVLRVDSIKCCAVNGTKGHFLWVEVSGCLHRLRHVRATSAWARTPGHSRQPRHSRRLWSKILLQHSSQIPGKKLALSVTAESCCDISGFANDVPKALQVSKDTICRIKELLYLELLQHLLHIDSILRWQYGNSTTKRSCLIGLEDFWNTI